MIFYCLKFFFESVCPPVNPLATPLHYSTIFMTQEEEFILRMEKRLQQTE